MKKILENIILCIKYPFLYPRNRFSRRHWTCYWIENLIKGKPATYKFSQDENGAWVKTIDKDRVIGLWEQAVSYEYDNPKYEHKFKMHIKSLPKFILVKLLYFLYDILAIFHCIPTYTELDAMEPGWRKAFGLQMMEELKQQCKKDHCTITIMQIKEKFGELRFYIGHGTEGIYEIISKYEDISRKTCGCCGKPATKITEGYIYPYCDECYSKIEYQPEYTCVNS